MVLVNASKKTVVSDKCHFANTLLKRMVGLLNRGRFDRGEGLLLDRCYGIHTFGMRFPIDVLFLDKDLRVIRAVKALPPFRTCVVKKSVYVLEVPAGALDDSQTAAGDQIQIRTANTDTGSPTRAAEADKVSSRS
ncbi:MAG TPA: DUF192 domain-containing protein [Verrucomicrobiae bacterium]|nr:DUF192 domain-containing protein [Verrucomicrobiae bacterium]